MNDVNRELKLNKKNTAYIGFAFFSILMLWGVYNGYGSIFLDRLLESRIEERTERSYIVGIIMALDNLFALFMLPIFGTLSDRTKTRFGRRMPYIFFGMLVSAIIFPLIAVAYILNSLAGVIIMMLMVLIVMNIYRNPAVALMPDVTPKPLRSRANGIINFIGYLGAIFAGALPLIFIGDDPINMLMPFLVVTGFMIVAMFILFLKIRENKLVEETAEDMLLGEKMADTFEEVKENVPLSKDDKFNMTVILISVFLWFAAFNAIETFISIYTDEVFGDFNYYGLIIIVVTFSSLLTFLPASLLASVIGRKKSVVIGLGLMILGLLLAYSINQKGLLLLSGFSLAGIGWAMINVNSYPMVVEMAHKNNVGKYTGYYYISSMLAQTFTPIVAGFVIMFGETYEMLFPYSGVLALLALFVFILVKERKDTPKDIKRGMDAFDVD